MINELFSVQASDDKLLESSCSPQENNFRPQLHVDLPGQSLDLDLGLFEALKEKPSEVIEHDLCESPVHSGNGSSGSDQTSFSPLTISLPFTYTSTRLSRRVTHSRKLSTDSIATLSDTSSIKS